MTNLLNDTPVSVFEEQSQNDTNNCWDIYILEALSDKKNMQRIKHLPTTLILQSARTDCLNSLIA